MKKIFSILALMLAVMTASAKVGYDLTVGKSEHGTITFKVGGNENATTAAEGDEVTVSIAPDGGYVVTEVSNEVYTSWGQANAPRRADIGITNNVEMTKVDDNTYTFTMPRANVEVSADYKISLDAKADETATQKDFDNVKLDMEPVGTPQVIDGLTYIPVAVTAVEVPTQARKTEISVNVETPVYRGNNVFVVQQIKADAFKTPAASNVVVTKVVMPATEEAIPVEAGAMKPNGTPILVETPLYLLDDYALMLSLKDNFEARKVSALVFVTNRFWTFSSSVDVIVPNNVTVYRVFTDNDAIRILPIDEANQSKIIKANNGVLLSCDEMKGGKAYEFVANPGRQQSGSVPATTDANDYAGNVMAPVIKDTHYDAGSILILKDNEFHTISANASKVPACKAVLSWAKAEK